MNILIIDDNKEIREAVYDILTYKFGKARIVTASNGEEGIFKASNEKFDLIISDYNLPKVNGLKLMKYLLRNNYHADEFLFMSGEVSREVFNEVKNLGVTNICVKPFDISVFLQKIVSLRLNK